MRIRVIDAFTDRTYVNELGVLASADRLEDVVHALGTLGLQLLAWYGVRIFPDAAARCAGAWG